MRSTFFSGALAAVTALAMMGDRPADGADRKVVTENFTATWCGYCPPVSEGLRRLYEDYPDQFFPLQVHGGDAYATPWGNARNNYYSVGGYPTTWTEGIYQRVGGGGTWQTHYNAHKAYMDARMAVPTDVAVQIGADQTGTTTFTATARITVDDGGQARNLQVHLCRTRWNAPSGEYNNTFRDAQSFSISVAPGESVVVDHAFNFGSDWPVREACSFFVLVQDQGGSGPHDIRNADWTTWPYATFDCNSNGVNDFEEIENGSALDCNLNGLPDECDISDGTSPDADGNGVPDECDDCNDNGVMDWEDIADGTSGDCNGNNMPDECDIAGLSSDDCNSNGTPDECEVAWLFNADSGQLNGIGGTTPQSFTVNGEDAIGDVTLSFTAVGDFAAAWELVNVNLNGASIGQAFVAGSACVEIDDAIVVPMSVWNAAVAENGGEMLIDMIATGGVDGGACGGTWIQVAVDHTGRGDNDVNENGVPDDCEGTPCPADLDGSGDVGFNDLLSVLGLWGPCPGCPEDLDGSGDVGFNDLLAILGDWGPCA